MPLESEKLIKDIVECDGDISLSLRQVIVGYLNEMGGPLNFGHELGLLQKDTQVSSAARVSLANSMTRLMGQYGDDAGENDLIDDDQLQRRLEELSKKVGDA